MSAIQLALKVGVPGDPGNTTHYTLLAETVRYNEWDINSLINLVIKQYHIDARKNIVVIYDLAQNVFGKHSEKHPELAKLTEALFLFFDDLSFYLKKEEQILFPNILRLSEQKTHSGSIDCTTFGMIKESTCLVQNEHRTIAKQLEYFRQVTNNYLTPADACTSYKNLFERMKGFEKDLLAHIDLENTILFPRAIRMEEKYLEKGQK